MYNGAGGKPRPCRTVCKRRSGQAASAATTTLSLPRVPMKKANAFSREAPSLPAAGVGGHVPLSTASIAIHRKPHTVLRRFAVQPRTAFSGAPCLKLSVDGYIADRRHWARCRYIGVLSSPPHNHRQNCFSICAHSWHHYWDPAYYRR